MIGIVRIALRRPYTFVVLALAIMIAGPLAALRTPVDIFPDIRIPVIAIIWSYTGLAPDQMAGRIVTQSSRGLTTTVNDIEHLEATSYNGLGIIKVFFQPGVDIRIANAQVTAVMQTTIKQLPPGATPPLILNYNASTVPISANPCACPNAQPALSATILRSNATCAARGSAHARANRSRSSCTASLVPPSRSARRRAP